MYLSGSLGNVGKNRMVTTVLHMSLLNTAVSALIVATFWNFCDCDKRYVQNVQKDPPELYRKDIYN